MAMLDARLFSVCGVLTVLLDLRSSSAPWGSKLWRLPERISTRMNPVHP